MTALLRSLHLAPLGNSFSELSGLVSVRDNRLPPDSMSEKVALREAKSLTGSKETQNIPIDYIFFRRFTDGRSSQVAAYILDNSQDQYSNEQIAELHYRVWLSGYAPLLYVEWPTRVDILRCAANADFWDDKRERPKYTPRETIQIVSEISRELDEVKVQRFSAYRLSDGTFWDDPENASWACADKAAHKSLIQAVIEADTSLEGNSNPLMRRLLLLFILAKYLEDRGVFPKNWFNQFHEGATSFRHVLASGNVQAVELMLLSLKEKFNGDIFDVSSKTGIKKSLTHQSLRHFNELLEARTLNRQKHLWALFSFNYIPVQVLSHLYQHFAQKGQGAIFTPPLLVDLMLDYAMPYENITGHETIFDPTCGSGIFLVGAFRRLVHHWQAQNQWSRPGVPQLKKMLKDAVFGAELDSNAAQVAAFNLALAVCDALQPKIIWNHLQFDKLIGSNILVGDVFENIEKIREIADNGFTTILGNPPFKSKLTKAAEQTRSKDKNNIPVPDKQMSYRIAEEAMTLLAPQGHMCLIQTAGFLYNNKARQFLGNFLSTNTVETILDFASIRNLFEGADPKTVAIVARLGEPKPAHEIVHLIFRRTKSVHERIGFELDHYDRHCVPQDTAIEFPFVWKANLLGGGRLAYLSEKFSTYKTLKEHWNTQGWTHGEGFIKGNAPKTGIDERKTADWLTGKAFLPTQGLTNDGIQSTMITKVTEVRFESPRKSERFTPPMFLINEHESLASAFWDKSYLTFLNSFVSVNAPSAETEKLKQFSEKFNENKNILRAFCLLRSSRSLVGKSTSILKADIDTLPWPNENGNFDLSFWEKTLLDDILIHTSKLIQVGQNAPVLTESVNEKVFNEYATLFTKLLGSIYKNLIPGKTGCFGGLAYQAFYFGKHSELDWPDDWSEKLAGIVHKEHSAIYTSRVVRFYEENTFIIVKPDRLRYWIPSTAIWDADETLSDMSQQGF